MAGAEDVCRGGERHPMDLTIAEQLKELEK